MKIFDSVAQMKLATIKAGQFVETFGYYTKGDAGQAKYLVVAAQAADGYGDHTLANGNIAVLQQVNNTVSILQYGFVPDGAKGVATGTDNSLAFKAVVANQSITNVHGAGGVFYFGSLGLDEGLATREGTELHIDWNGAYITVNGDNSVLNTGMTFFRLLDVRGSMVGFTFEDVGYDFENDAGRGCQPFSIRNETKSTKGYRYGDCHIVRGQSLLTCSALKPFNFQATGVELVGSITGKDVYYGINLAGSGNSVSGSYSVDRVRRLVFLYNVTDVDLTGYAREGQPSSGNVNISNSVGSNHSTNRIKLRMTFDVLNGPVLFNTNNAGGDPADDGEGEISDIDIDIKANSIGSNLSTSTPIVIFRNYDSVNGPVVGSTDVMKDIDVKLNIPKEYRIPFRNNSDSPNYGLLTTRSTYNRANTSELGSFTLSKGYDEIQVSKRGDFTTTTIDVPIRFINVVESSTLIRYKFEVMTQRDTGFFGQASAITVLDIIGHISSVGAITILQTYEASKSAYGETPTFTLTPNGEFINIEVNGITASASNFIVVTAKNCSL